MKVESWDAFKILGLRKVKKILKIASFQGKTAPSTVIVLLEILNGRTSI